MDARFLDCGPNLLLLGDGDDGKEDGSPDTGCEDDEDACGDAKSCVSTVVLSRLSSTLSIMMIPWT